MKMCTDIHDPQGMNPDDSGDHLSLPPMRPEGQSFHLSGKYISISLGWIW